VADKDSKIERCGGRIEQRLAKPFLRGIA